MRKKILFIAPEFYDYHKVISKKLHELEGDVVFFPEENLNFLYILSRNINKKLVDVFQYIRFFIFWQKIKNQHFTHFFAIRVHKMPVWFVEKVKKKNPEIKTIMYQWDSIKNNPYTYLIPHFDKSYTFDYQDFKSRKDLEFHQLFYTEDIKKLRGKKDFQYDLFCLNSFTLERYQLMERIIAYCDEKKIKIKTYCYIPQKTYVRFTKMKGIDLKKELLSFEPMSRNDYLHYLEKSKVILDLNHSSQSGLSVRVIEALGADKDLITTNKSILENPLYNKNKIQVLDVDNIDFDLNTFLDQQTKADGLYIDNWIRKFFE